MKSNIKTEWDLTQLYKSPDDPQIENDIVFSEKAHKSFANKYRKDDSYLKNDTALQKALIDYEKLSDIPSIKPYFYFNLYLSIDFQNNKLHAKSNLILQRFQKMDNQILFFGVNLSKIDKKLQKQFLKSPKLKPYKYFLEKTFEAGKYVLSESEEKILSLKSLPAHSLWTDFFQKNRTKQTVNHKGKEITISEASNLVGELPTQKERADLYFKIAEKNIEIAHIAEAELNAIVLDKKIEDELRGYKEPYDSTVLHYENNKKSIAKLVDLVTASFPLAHRFFKVKAKMLKLKKLKYSDRNAQVGKTNKKITFEESYEIVKKVFNSLDPEFSNILDRIVERGSVDVYSKVGKRSGAFCASEHKIPTFIFLNHIDNFDSLMTFAHEMGHAIHSEFSKTQPVFYEGYSISTAEVASTLFEAFVFYDQFEKLSEKEKIVALHDKIRDDLSTIHLQISFFNFEKDLHRIVREKGHMTKEEMAECMGKNIKDFLGPVFEDDDRAGYSFVGIPHIRSFFYVYTYAMGQLTSKALYARYKEDPSYMVKIKKLLSLGGSMSPESIFKTIGIDVMKPDFFKKGLEKIEEDIATLEALVNKNK